MAGGGVGPQRITVIGLNNSNFVAKPNLTFFAGKITFILGLNLGQTPSENQHILRRNYNPSIDQIA